MKKKLVLGWILISAVAGQAAVTVSNLDVSQQEGTKLVDVYYDVSCDTTNIVLVSITISNGASIVSAPSLSGDEGSGVTTGAMKHIVWNAGADWNGNVADLAYNLFVDDGLGGTPAVAPVAKTGQTVSSRTGDDGHLQRGVTWPNPRFTDLGDGTVTDNLTGLVWIKEPHALPGNPGNINWNGAIDFCNALTYASNSNWRLPSYKELMSLVDYGQVLPALPPGHPFIGIKYGSNNYWSSTTFAYDTDNGWSVGMITGSGVNRDKNGANGLGYAWAVRGSSAGSLSPVPKTGQVTIYRTRDDGDLAPGVAWPASRFLYNGNGTVADNLTGLEWAQSPHALPGNSGTMSWDGAVDYCSGLTYAGHSDWRLPNLKELESLVHYGSGSWGNLPLQWLNYYLTPFTGVKLGIYWSGTTRSTNAWWVHMGYGHMSSAAKYIGYYVWPVRDKSVGTAEQTVSSSLDSRNYLLTVTSAYGAPVPNIGTFSNYCWKSTITSSVEGVVSVDGTNYTCSGWNGTGAVPIIGSGTNTGPIVLTTVSSSIDWRWIVDADSDHMPDDWELLYFGSTTGGVATIDGDGDGYDNWQEYILGSNPTNGGSSFLFQPSPSQPTNTAFSVDFTTVTGRLYTVECTDELGSGDWQVLTNFVGDGSAVQVIDPVDLPSCFYHVQIDWVE